MAEYIERERVRNPQQTAYRKAIAEANLIEDIKTLADDEKEFIRKLIYEPAADVVEVVRKPIKGYEGYYEVDQFGRVFGVDRVISVDDSGRKYDKPRDDIGNTHLPHLLYWSLEVSPTVRATAGAGL